MPLTFSPSCFFLLIVSFLLVCSQETEGFILRYLMKSQYHTVILEDIPVRFPFEPYPVQIEYMRSVIRTLNASQEHAHAALESPTGTGKTLSLLCSVCAWLLWSRKKERTTENLSSFSTCKIIYTTRTHSQVSQVMREFRRCGYEKELQSCVLGSREQLCVHSSIRELKGHTLRAACANARAVRSCRFSNHTPSTPSPSQGRVMDMEDLCREGLSTPYCPYFYTREKVLPTADIIFCPYNYALDPSVMTQDLQLKGNILIIDEAHNLPSVCLSTTSIEIATTDIAVAMGDTSKAIECLEQSSTTPEDSSDLPPGDESRTEDVMQELIVLRTLLYNLQNELEALPLELHKDTNSYVYLKSGEHVYSFLSKLSITFSTAQLFLEQVEHTMELAISGKEKKGLLGSCQGLQTVLDFIKVIFPRLKDRTSQDVENNFKRSYNMVVQAVSGVAGTKRLLSLWCQDCSMCMQQVHTKTRNLLITSGTLTPIDSYTNELGIPFHTILQGPHFISSSQICASICNVSGCGTRLNGNYQNRSNADYQMGIGTCIVNLCRIIPDGILVFFPSYSFMQQLLESWQSRNCEIWSTLAKHKHVFVEPRTTTETRNVVQKFQLTIDNSIADVKTKGAVLFAVCRGKISEGVDFSDRHGRSVIIIGIPYASRNDLNIFLRREYLDKCSRDRTNNSTNFLTGEVWYRQEALRAVNQAMGRVIRHKDDYGSIILLDERFKNQTRSLSKWIQPFLATYDNFIDCQRANATFFSSREPSNATFRHSDIAVSQTETKLPSIFPSSASAAFEYELLTARDGVSESSINEFRSKSTENIAGESIEWLSGTRSHPQKVFPRRPCSAETRQRTECSSKRMSSESFIDIDALPPAFRKSDSVPLLFGVVPTEDIIDAQTTSATLDTCVKNENKLPERKNIQITNKISSQNHIQVATAPELEAFFNQVRIYLSGESSSSYGLFKRILQSLGTLRSCDATNTFRNFCKDLYNVLHGETETGQDFLRKVRDLIIPKPLRSKFTEAAPVHLAKFRKTRHIDIR